MIPVRLAERGIARLVARVGRKPLLVRAAGFATGSYLTHKTDTILPPRAGGSIVLWLALLVIGGLMLYHVLYGGGR